jgi:hypothetical protein
MVEVRPCGEVGTVLCANAANMARTEEIGSQAYPIGSAIVSTTCSRECLVITGVNRDEGTVSLFDRTSGSLPTAPGPRWTLEDSVPA